VGLAEAVALAKAAHSSGDSMSLADTPTPPPQEGTWILIAPDGRRFTGPSPFSVVGLELRQRVPVEVGAARILRELGLDSPTLETSPVRIHCDSCGATDGMHSEECENMKCELCQFRHGPGELCIV
jgi:hypothetical protein